MSDNTVHEAMGALLVVSFVLLLAGSVFAVGVAAWLTWRAEK